MDPKTLARVGAIAFVAVAITATVIELSRKEERPEAAPPRPPAQAGATDPLREELFRCQSLGEAGPRDPACLRAWAESRRRFLTSGTTRSQTGFGLPRSGAEAGSRGAAPGGE